MIELKGEPGTMLHIWLEYNSSDPNYFENSSLKMNITWKEIEQQNLKENQGLFEIATQRFELQHFYHKKSWSEAEEFCQRKGGHLASIVSQKEQEELVGLLGSRYFWLGGSDAEKEGQWTWTDQKPWSVQYWNESEPNGRGGENCLAIIDGIWTDNDCDKDTLDGFVCRLPTTMTNFWSFARLFAGSKQNKTITNFLQKLLLGSIFKKEMIQLL